MKRKKEPYRIHNGFSSDSDSGKSEFDEMYYRYKPSPLSITPLQIVNIKPTSHQYPSQISPHYSILQSNLYNSSTLNNKDSSGYQEAAWATYPTQNVEYATRELRQISTEYDVEQVSIKKSTCISRKLPHLSAVNNYLDDTTLDIPNKNSNCQNMFRLDEVTNSQRNRLEKQITQDFFSNGDQIISDSKDMTSQNQVSSMNLSETSVLEKLTSTVTQKTQNRCQINQHEIENPSDIFGTHKQTSLHEINTSEINNHIPNYVNGNRESIPSNTVPLLKKQPDANGTVKMYSQSDNVTDERREDEKTEETNFFKALLNCFTCFCTRRGSPRA